MQSRLHVPVKSLLNLTRNSSLELIDKELKVQKLKKSGKNIKYSNWVKNFKRTS